MYYHNFIFCFNDLVTKLLLKVSNKDSGVKKNNTFFSLEYRNIV